MSNYKTHSLRLIVLLSFITLVNVNRAIASSTKSVKITTDYNAQDPEPKQQPGKLQDNKENPKAEKPEIGIIKSVPKARRQAIPKMVKPNIDVIKKVRPIIKPKIDVPVRVKVKI